MLFLQLLVQHLPALSLSIDPHQFSLLTSDERGRLLFQTQLDDLDSTAFVATYQALHTLASKDEDTQSLWILDYYRFLQRGALKSNAQENIQLLLDLEARARGIEFPVGEVVARHYRCFEQYYAKTLSHSALYTNILLEFEQMTQIGFASFVDYDLPWLLYHNGRFMYQLGDYEKALEYFKVAERFIEPENGNTFILVLNHLQSIYQKQGDLSNGITYAKKILAFTQSKTHTDPEWTNFYTSWQGLSSSDIASMLVQQGAFAASEPYARQGYELARTADTSNIANPSIEYVALQVLVSTKLEMEDLEGADPLLVRLDELYEKIGHDYDNYFNNIEYFNHRARYHEMKGEFATAIQYSKLVKPLEDSLARRNDARQLEQLKQKLEAEKYLRKIREVEEERESERWLRKAAFFILGLVVVLALLYFQRLQRQRKQRIAELRLAKSELSTLTQRYKEKSAIAEKLRLEMQDISNAEERSEHLEQLINSTILTEQDWLHFRHVFEKVYPGFISNKKALHPELTPAELRYLALEKLDLSTSEMANMLGVSSSAVRKTRARMRKKIEN